MNEASWAECVANSMSIKISPDNARANSLMETAIQRIKFTEKKKADDEELKFVFEDYYSSMIEIVHAILLIKGYKVLNHICLGYYLRDILDMHHLYRIFDNLRIKRNNIVYYGKSVAENIVKEDISDIKQLIKALENIYSKELKKK